MKRNVRLDLLMASDLSPFWSHVAEIEVGDSDEFPAEAVVAAWLADDRDHDPVTLSQYLAWRSLNGESGEFEDAFTVFQMANITIVNFFDLDNEVFILVARDPDHVEN